MNKGAEYFFSIQRYRVPLSVGMCVSNTSPDVCVKTRLTPEVGLQPNHTKTTATSTMGLMVTRAMHEECVCNELVINVEYPNYTIRM